MESRRLAIGPPLVSFLFEEGTPLSKNLKILGVLAAALALLCAMARMFVADDLESWFPTETPSTLPSATQTSLESGLSAPAHVAGVEPSVVDESRPPLQSAHDAAEEPLDSAEQPARHGLERVFRVHAELSLVDFGPDGGSSTEEHERIVLNTGEAPIITVDSRLQTLDVGVDGLPSAALEVRRRYEYASCTFRQSPAWGLIGVHDRVLTGTSHLEGTQVLFTWDANASDYQAQVTSGGTDTDLDRLDDLALDLDLDALRPHAQAGTGFRWTLPASALAGVIRPGGDLQFKYGQRRAPEGCFVALWTSQGPATAALEGALEATVKGRQERDGLLLVEVELKATVRSSCVDGDISMKLQLEFTGDLLWDSRADRAYALDAECTVELALGPTPDAEHGARSARLHSTLRFRGEATFQLKTQLVE